MTYDLDQIDQYRDQLIRLRAKLCESTQEDEVERIKMLVARVSYEMNEYIRAIEDLLNADCYGGIH